MKTETVVCISGVDSRQERWMKLTSSCPRPHPTPEDEIRCQDTLTLQKYPIPKNPNPQQHCCQNRKSYNPLCFMLYLVLFRSTAVLRDIM